MLVFLFVKKNFFEKDLFYRNKMRVGIAIALIV
jgi:hypothetical protein